MESKRTLQSPLSELDSSGALLLNLTIPASDLTLGNKLGQGAYGVVYKAKWRNKDVAVKQLLLPNPSQQEKNEFKQEAAVMFQIAADSDHVVRLYKITLQPQLSLVMELMPNGSLYELLQNNRDKPLDWGIRYRLAMDISTGLEDIHSHGVLHRDLKSLNVLLDGNLRAKLTDFGMATTKLTSSRHSSVQGTPHWMAPEVANGDADSQGSDVYSLGMVLFELAAHRHPYPNLKPMQVLLQVSQGKQETIPADCPATFKQLILDCWTVAEKRPKAVDVTTRLRPMLDSKETSSTPAAGGGLDSLTSGQLKGSAEYQVGAAPTAPHRSAVLQQTPASLVSIVSPSASHPQPQSPTPSTPPATSQTTAGKPLEDKTFQTGYGLYSQGQYQKALSYFQDAAKTHYPPAYLYLGIVYQLGHGVAKDPDQSQNWYEKAQQREGWFIQQAGSGKAAEQFYLGEYHCLAASEKDRVQAVSWYRHAAQQGHTGAQFRLGQCYANGQGVTQDREQATHWYRRAAEQGHAPAQCSLGMRYQSGQGVEEDVQQAKYWYEKAAAQGYERAKACLKSLEASNQEPAAQQPEFLTSMVLPAISTSQAQAPVTKPKPSEEKSNGIEAFQKGYQFYNLGQLQKALPYFEQAAEAHYPPAYLYLGLMHEEDNGVGVAKDLSISAIWYKKAQQQESWFIQQAKSGEATAQFYLGCYYQFAAGAKKDLMQAVAWYRCAAGQGHTAAQFNLGMCYANGIGVSQDLAQAEHWYKKAVARLEARANALQSLPSAVSHPTPSTNTPSSFFTPSKPDKKGEAKQAVNNAPPVAPKPVPEKSAAPVVVNEKSLGQLLKCVAEGQQEQAEALIKLDSNLLLAAGKVTDLSGRTFDNITAFQYALWAMDSHMWTMIQKHLPAEAQAEQHAVLESKGTAHGKHFDLQPLLEALKICIDNDKKWDSDQQAEEQWCKKVGGAQKLLPAHVVNEYCRPDCPFDPCLVEWTSPLPRTCAVENVWDGSKHMNGGSWFAAPQLGVSFAFYRCAQGSEAVVGAGLGDEFLQDELESLQALWNARTQQLKLLAAKLAAEPNQSELLADAKALGQLLQLVAEGEQDQAEALIKKDSNLLLAAGKVTDLSGRTFNNITAFQYALWAMDYHMWTMIQKYLPTEAQAKQHTLLESKGTAHGKHFDLQPLLDALETYYGNAEKWGFDRQAADQWCKKIGGAQKLLPTHVVNEYCRPDRPFDPCPAEWALAVPRTRAVEVYDGSKRVNGEWFTSLYSSDGLRFPLPFYRGPTRVRGWRAITLPPPERPPRADRLRATLCPDVPHDLKSLRALWNARTQQLKALADSLAVEPQSTIQVSLK